ncbi:gamma-glutamyltransferase. Threonine peptidase. MEROPS family T03 [Lentzea xinjiangensis]|uniref:Gamma-glutamyltransferase. Threonine peptidase. MEROPS family T03 n=1 Tax=Lentzea xinjiangensis TaxID=402600 RepID=A0A1H9M4G5_9PSEU|nr:gamma-glutamyltransferase [Lentzea xinjiangensis]SER18397.1 gamma-glutamyltransferase. Threonine peptidase. MEROPS family T03 [Lentzea xinjiangensis]
MRGVIAAGHPLTAGAGASMLRAGGNAVDAAVAAMLTSCVTEPLLTGLGAAGYLVVAPAGEAPVLLDFSAEAPGRDRTGDRAPLAPVTVHFGDAQQEFHAGPSSVAAYGLPAGAALAATYGRAPLEELVATAAKHAREGHRINRYQAYVTSLLLPLARSAGLTAFEEGELLVQPELAEALDRLGSEGAAPFYTGDIAGAVAGWITAHGGDLSRADLAAYRVAVREPLHVRHRGRDIHTNPPPAAGGALLAQMLEALPDNPSQQDLVRALATPKTHLNRLGSTTHISVLDADGTACSVTTTNGAGSGISIAGVHLNNMMGEEDLSPDGFFSHAPGDRLPSMMAPTVATRDGRAELVLGSAGSSRICGAILQVLVNVLDRGMPAQEAVDAPRMHLSGDHLHVEPGIRPESELPVTFFRAPNMFFGGCQVVEMTESGLLRGGADHRRDGAFAVV